MKKWLFAICIALNCCATATGSHIVTGKARPPINPATVKIIAQLPKQYEPMGIITASSDAGWTEQEDYEYALVELKKQAAQIGANRVFIESVGASSEGGFYQQIGNDYGYYFSAKSHTITGKALYVKPKRKKR